LAQNVSSEKGNPNFPEASKKRSAIFLGSIDICSKIRENTKIFESFCCWLRYIHPKGVRAAIGKYVTKENKTDHDIT
tara:strand:+ start:1228 stop:1458 length:231 start_codon:yes stop_codon:yes gene_type:complete